MHPLRASPSGSVLCSCKKLYRCTMGKSFDETTVYCQWDPDRNINGNAINRAAIQIGLKGETLRNFLIMAYAVLRI